MQGKSNNLRVVEDGKKSRNIEPQPRLTSPQFYDRRFSVATLVHQPQNKITCLLVDPCFGSSISSCIPHCENESLSLSLPYSYIPPPDWIHSQKHRFPMSSPNYISSSTCQLLVRYSFAQERLNLVDSSKKCTEPLMLVDHSATSCK